MNSDWYAGMEGKRSGPFSEAELVGLIKAGKVGTDTLLWRKGMADWKPAHQVQELASLFEAEPPPLPSA